LPETQPIEAFIGENHMLTCRSHFVTWRILSLGTLILVQACSGAPADGPTTGTGNESEQPPATVDVPNVVEPSTGVATLSVRPSNKTCLAPTKKADGTTAFPSKLSETGCFSPTDLHNVAEGVIAYQINSPLWADGATKRRWFALPDGTTMTRSGPDDISLPPGSVLLKEFSMQGRVLETRVLARRLDGVWGAGTYRWNTQQTDAELVLGDWQTEQIGGSQWTYFGPAGCMLCHSTSKGTDLGIRDGQFNKDIAADNTGLMVNQEAALERLGLLDKAATPLATGGTLVSIDSTASLNKRARSYLDVNCASCHSKGGRAFMGFDMSIDKSFQEMGLCNAAPAHGDLGAVDARFIVPGTPARSVLSLRMHALDRNRMPRFGSSKVDAAAVAVIDAWISAMTSCQEPPQ
jgi:uncharacterized repeat protein (TIGR03806 family)